MTDREILDKLTAHLPRRKMTDRDRKIFDDAKRYRESGGGYFTQEEWEQCRRTTSAPTSPTEKK